MSRIGQSIKAGHQPLLTRNSERRSQRPLAAAACLGGAVVLGAVLAMTTTLPTSWLALTCLAICGLLGLVVWHWAKLPLVPVLRFALVFSFSFRLEINFFVIEKFHEAPPGINLSLVMILALLLLAAKFADNRVSRRSERIFPLSYTLVFWSLFTCCAISVAYGIEQMLGFYALLGLLTAALIGYAAAACFADRQALREAALAVAVSVGVSGLIGLLQYFFDVGTNWKILGAIAADEVQKIGGGEVSRVAGLQTMANAFAWYLVTFLPVIIAPVLLFFRNFRLLEKLIMLGGAGLGMIALILTFARGSWLSFVVAMLLLAALAYKATAQAERAEFRWKLGSVCALVIFLALPFGPMIYTRLTEDDRGAAESRIPLAQIALNIIKDNPLFGVGLSGYESVHRRYDDTPEKILDDFDWPVHNIFLHVTAEAGLPAIFLFLLLTAIICHQAWPVLRSPDPFQRAIMVGLLVGLFAFIFTGMKELGSLGSSLYRIYFFFLGLMMAVRRCMDKESDLRRAESGVGEGGAVNG